MSVAEQKCQSRQFSQMTETLKTLELATGDCTELVDRFGPTIRNIETKPAELDSQTGCIIITLYGNRWRTRLYRSPTITFSLESRQFYSTYWNQTIEVGPGFSTGRLVAPWNLGIDWDRYTRVVRTDQSRNQWTSRDVMV